MIDLPDGAIKRVIGAMPDVRFARPRKATMQQESADSTHSTAARRRAKSTPGRWNFVRWLCCLLIVANLAGCCYVPGGRCTDWWRNGLKVGPNYCRPAAPVSEHWIDYANPR